MLYPPRSAVTIALALALTPHSLHIPEPITSPNPNTMASPPTTPKHSTTDEAEVFQTSTSNQDNNTEMVDTRGKNPLNCMHSSSTESNKHPNTKPPKKKISPNHPEPNPLPPTTPKQITPNSIPDSTFTKHTTKLCLPLWQMHPLMVAASLT